MAKTLVGYAAKFGVQSQDLGGFVEIIQPGTFSKALLRDDVRALFNHDPSQVLGRNRSHTLSLREDDVGLHCVITPPETSYARDLLANVAAGNITQMSFSFKIQPGGDSWSRTKDGRALRAVSDVVLYDVSAVTYPATLQTTLAVRETIDEPDRRDVVTPRAHLTPAAPVRLALRRKRLRVWELCA